MLEDLFVKANTHIDYFFEHLDIQKAEKVLDICRTCKGMLFFTGVGKSGYVAQKIAATITSTGTRALFLSPTDALHGDIGIVNTDDVFLIFSKSGDTDELLNLIPCLRNKEAKIIGIISNPKSRLAKVCDLFIELPLQKELCPFDLVPTTSTTIQMIFGDVLTVGLMKHKKFSKDEYGINHPAGTIGKRVNVKVMDLMLTGSAIPVCHPENKLVDILVDLSNKKCGCVVVVDEQFALKGIFTDGDLRRALQKNGVQVLETPIWQIMTKTPRMISPHVLALEAMRQMEADQTHPITVLPVVDDHHKVVGLIKMHDIVQSGI
ncbi:KpsF/GutQ family sugar-phosphate isomerase [Parachlamydia sp. AcF125]|uniref:KpsF/GutQ family sugar-phosphate isomerase n=1 Tax=Parachlamydia sp. AcF125 TaxID=2795736 RepID=UPI001BC8F012|nr:KpsF/GutQ family sugar-phosphate isomerase [Parachlamydia sp. AcF125]MBS4167855.1 Arabinose 5-phosphate isomerase KdsD [Parachlamydia sp. AcF125]